MRNEIPKDYVQKGQHQCKACGVLYNSGEILISKRLKSIPKDKTVTDLGWCPEHQKMLDNDRILLVECDPEKTKIVNDIVKPKDAYRTGVIIGLKRSFAEQLMPDLDPKLSMAFIDPEATAKIQKIYEENVDLNK